MRVLLLGGGGREHALAWRLTRDPDVSAIVTAPGNPGLAALGECRAVDLADPGAILALAREVRADLTVVGPEAPLDQGVADTFAVAGLPIVGPTRQAAQLECSKAFAKDFMTRHGIPTARCRICRTASEAIAAVSGAEFGFPVVVKADGLAAGKGVVIAATRAEAESAIKEMMVDARFGAAGATVVIEECLTGPEVSFFVLSDGTNVVPLGSAQDHKRIFDDDQGPNTGGMGAFAPSPLMTSALEADTMESVVHPVLEGMRRDGHPYRGFLYVSLMLTPAGPRVIEFNVRFGDPEAQVILPALEGRVAETLMASATGALKGTTLATSRDRFVGVVMAARGYPGTVTTGDEITGLVEAAAMPGVIVFHAGTKIVDGKLVTAGGRVLTVVGRGQSFQDAMQRAYTAVNRIKFDGMQYRRDIGRKAIRT